MYDDSNFCNKVESIHFLLFKIQCFFFFLEGILNSMLGVFTEIDNRIKPIALYTIFHIGLMYFILFGVNLFYSFVTY